jgi:hypothetical protein
MNKTTLALTIALTFFMVSCTNLNKYIPENFDGNEYMKLSELAVMSTLSESCNSMELSAMRYHSAVLMKYSEGTLKENIADIYEGIHTEIMQLVERTDPSPAYCKVKRKNITTLIDQAMDTFGDRKK